MVAIATGRSTASVLDYLRQLGWEETPIVCYNGALGYVASPGSSGAPRLTRVFADVLSAEATRSLVTLAEDCGLVLQYYDGETGEVFANPRRDEHERLVARYAELTGRPQTRVVDFEANMLRGPSAKVLILTEDPAGLIAEADRRFPRGKFNYFPGSTHPFFVEFLAASASKGAGLAQLCSHLGVPLERVVAFGDGENDKEFLEVAGLGLAMKNARPLAKAAAKKVLQVQ